VVAGQGVTEVGDFFFKEKGEVAAAIVWREEGDFVV
jgi:hypothetical protein